MDTVDAYDCAADALRRYEQDGKKLNYWQDISAAQRRRWREKAKVVVEAYNREIVRARAALPSQNT